MSRVHSWARAYFCTTIAAAAVGCCLPHIIQEWQMLDRLDLNAMVVPSSFSIRRLVEANRIWRWGGEEKKMNLGRAFLKLIVANDNNESEVHFFFQRFSCSFQVPPQH